uniref:Uncharacterized protein n=1 Tax=Anguilla anguilla TaxID=7936 RepID=A0A0E9ULR8_ANGAN
MCLLCVYVLVCAMWVVYVQENTTVRQRMRLGQTPLLLNVLDEQCGYISASQLQTHRAEGQYLLSVFRKHCNSKTLSEAVTLTSEGEISYNYIITQ